MQANEIMTKDDWIELFREDSEEAFIYCQVTQDITKRLEDIASLKSFDEMKNELLAFIKDRNDFTTFAQHYNGS